MKQTGLFVLLMVFYAVLTIFSQPGVVPVPEFLESVEDEMVYVKGGRFIMGNEDGNWESPQ